MITKGTLRFALILFITLVNPGLIGSGRASSPAGHNRPLLTPIYVEDDEFLPGDWTVTAEVTGGASYTVTRQLSGGFGSPAFRHMSHRIPPVESGLATIAVTHIYTAVTYDPSVQGAITLLNYREAGIILSFPWAEAFSTTRPVVMQDGTVYSTPQFVRFIAENSSHDWETKYLIGLTADDFSPLGGPETEHPDFSTSGEPIQFGFIRLNSRSSTLPPVPSDQDLVIDQGVDDWQVTLYSEEIDPPNQPPQAVDDVFILNGYNNTLPVSKVLDVLRNDSDPDFDLLEIVTATQSAYGSTSLYGFGLIYYQLEEAQTHDTFEYTVGDRFLTSTAQADIFIDCACTVFCLNSLEPPPDPASFAAADSIDLPLIYRVRESVLKTTPVGQRYVDMYYRSNPEILVNVLLNEPLRLEAVSTVELWQPNLSSLVDGDGSALVTQAQVDAIASFLMNLSAVSSPALQQLIASELVRLGPLDDYVGLTVSEAKRQAIGDAAVFLPLLQKP
jgi:hypothetical protein